MRGHLHLEKHQRSSFQYNIPITKTQVKTIFKNEVIFPPGGALVAWNKQNPEARRPLDVSTGNMSRISVHGVH